MMTAGRVLPISPPTVGSSAAHQTSPRRILLFPVAVAPTPLVPIVGETFVHPGFHPGTHFGRVFRVRGLLGGLLPVLFLQPIFPPGVAAVGSDHVWPGNFLEEAPDAAFPDLALEAVVELVRDLNRQLLGHLRNLYVNARADNQCRLPEPPMAMLVLLAGPARAGLVAADLAPACRIVRITLEHSRVAGHLRRRKAER